MRFAPGIVLLVGMGLVGHFNPVRAQVSAANVETLANAARLVVRVQNQPALTGEFRIAPDGTISLPVIGRISVKDKTLLEVEDEISAKLASLGGNDGRAAVEIGEYRDLFVSGLVAKPGAYPWQPGLTVAKAFAVAGGLYRAPELGTVRSLEATTGRLKALNDRKYALATLARFQAEQKGLSEIQMPLELAALAGPDEAQRLVGSQLALMTSRQSALEDQLQTLEKGASLAEQELESLREQSERIAQQLATLRKSSAAIEDLQAKGYASAERGLEQKLRVLDLEEKGTNVAVAIARIQATAADLRRQAEDAKRARAAEIESRIVDLHRDLAQTKIELDATDLSAATDAKSQRPVRPIRYQLIRGDAEPVDVSETASLLPGDVVVVMRGGVTDPSP